LYIAVRRLAVVCSKRPARQVRRRTELSCALYRMLHSWLLLLLTSLMRLLPNQHKHTFSRQPYV
jgi:hypothetical protein